MTRDARSGTSLSDPYKPSLAVLTCSDESSMHMHETSTATGTPTRARIVAGTGWCLRYSDQVLYPSYPGTTCSSPPVTASSQPLRGVILHTLQCFSCSYVVCGRGIAGLLNACADIECVLVCVSTVWFCVFTAYTPACANTGNGVVHVVRGEPPDGLQACFYHQRGVALSRATS